MLVYFIVYLFAEVMITSQFIEYFGGLIFFLEIVATFIIGVIILTNFKYAIVEQLNNLAFGKIDHTDLISVGIFTLLGSIFLIIPGLLSDVLGLLMQFEFFAFFVKNRLFKERLHTNSRSAPGAKNNFKKRNDNDYIDVEVVDDDKNSTDGNSINR